MQIHEEAQRKAEAEAAAVLQERQRAAEEAKGMAAAARQRALTVHQIQAQQEAEARRKYDPHPSTAPQLQSETWCTSCSLDISMAPQFEAGPMNAT